MRSADAQPFAPPATLERRRSLTLLLPLALGALCAAALIAETLLLVASATTCGDTPREHARARRIAAELDASLCAPAPHAAIEGVAAELAQLVSVDGRQRDARSRRSGQLSWTLAAAALFAAVTLALVLRLRVGRRLRAELDEDSGAHASRWPSIAVVVLDARGHVASWNAGAERRFGWRADEIVGHSYGRLFTAADRDARKPERALDTAARVGSSWTEELRVRKDGSQVLADVTLTALHDPLGQIAGFATVERDLSAPRTGSAIDELHAELARRVGELAAANDELEAFSYSVSHDLRGPLRAIDGFSKILIEQYGDKLDQQGRHFLSRVRAGSQRMGHLIDDLLSLARINRAAIQRSDVDLALLAREIVDELRREGPERSIDVAIVEEAPARGDARLLRVALVNLLGNAWKFTGKTANPKIEIGWEMRDGVPTYHVRDNGAGFDMLYAHKLFVPFQRLHEPFEFDGTGIGLATVYRIITRHGGRLWAESAPGRGATFWFTLGS